MVHLHPKLQGYAEEALWFLGEAYLAPYIINRNPRLFVPWTVYCAATTTIDFLYFPVIVASGWLVPTRMERCMFYGQAGLWLGMNLFAGEWFYDPYTMLGISIKGGVWGLRLIEGMVAGRVLGG